MAKKKICKNGVCRIVNVPAKNASPAAQPVAAAPAPVSTPPVVMTADQAMEAANQGPVLPNQLTNPGQFSPAQMAQSPLSALESPLMNPDKGNYKSSPYKRSSHGMENIGGGAIVGAGQGGNFGPKGAAIGAAVGAGGGIMATLKNALINKEVKKHVKLLNKYLLRDNPNDAETQRKILKSQAFLNEVSPGRLAPGQEHLPIEQQHEIVNRSIKAANLRGSEAQYPGKGAPGSEGSGVGGAAGNTMQFPNFTTQQMGLQNNLIDRVMQDRSNFDPIAQTEMRRFQEETLPGIAEQQFGKNPQSYGSSYPRELGRGAEGLAERLASMRSQFEGQKEHGYLQSAMAPAFNNLYTNRQQQQEQPSFWQNLVTSAMPGAMRGFGQMAQGLANPQQQQQQGGVQKSEGQPISNSSPLPRSMYDIPSRQVFPLSQSAVKGQDVQQQALMKEFEKGNKRLGGSGI